MLYPHNAHNYHFFVGQTKIIWMVNLVYTELQTHEHFLKFFRLISPRGWKECTLHNSMALINVSMHLCMVLHMPNIMDQDKCYKTKGSHNTCNVPLKQWFLVLSSFHSSKFDIWAVCTNHTNTHGYKPGPAMNFMATFKDSLYQIVHVIPQWTTISSTYTKTSGVR